AYETFYDEKRPFFLEGKHILEFANNENEMMFYSRRIGAMPSYRPQDIDNIENYASTPSYIPIIGALKLTGTNRNGVTIGLLESVTARTTSQVMRNGVYDREVTEPLTLHGSKDSKELGRKYIAGRYGHFCESKFGRKTFKRCDD